MRYVVWGAGTRAKRIVDFWGIESIIAFIDMDSEKVGSYYFGKKIISFNEYMKEYKDELIIISNRDSKPVVYFLESHNVHTYLRFDECPTEIQYEYADREYVLKLNLFDNAQTIAIYGLTPYSLYLYEKNKEKGKVYLIADINDEKRIREIEKRIAAHIYSCDGLGNLDVKRIYVTSPYLSDSQKKKLNNKAQVHNIYDFKDENPCYKNDTIKKFKGCCEGKRVFIIATGPSLKSDDLDKLWKNNEICIAMNRIHTMYEKTKWRPNYYVITDERVFQLCKKNIYDTNETEVVRFICDSAATLHNKVRNNIYQMHNRVELDYEGITKFSDELTTGIYCIASVTYACIQLAMYMGAEEIILLGVDHNYNGNSNNNGNHFYDDSSNNQIAYAANTVLMEESYRVARKQAENRGIKIYNATRGGKLEVFERIDFDKIFEEE